VLVKGNFGNPIKAISPDKKTCLKVSFYRMRIFGNKIQKFYGGKGCFFFEGLYQQVNRKALVPFFRLAEIYLDKAWWPMC
jgi:hypothetical protein